MARFFFHVFHGDGKTTDEEGLDVEDQSAARRIALDSIRSMVAEAARAGLIDLDGNIAIADAADNLLLSVEFEEAFEIRMPERKTLP
jgi:hypothetical protein